MMKIKFVKFVLCSFFCSGFLISFIKSQDTNDIFFYFQLDSTVIEASRENLAVNSFIQYMIDDKSFYQAFKNLRSSSYRFTNSIEMFKGQKSLASYKSEANQMYTKPCREMNEWNKSISGNMLEKDGDFEYFTAKLYDRLFFTHGKVCDSSSHKSKDNKAGKMERYISELKTLMFDPGTETHIPFLGNKTNIFDKEMTTYYNYLLSATEYNDLPCYLFDIRIKDEYENNKEGKTVIKKLLTWFDQTSHQIVKRQYVLQASTIAYSFDIAMDVDINNKNGIYYPINIQYDGEWKVIGKKRENAKFTLKIFDFK